MISASSFSLLITSFLSIQASTHHQRYQWKTHDQNLDTTHSVRNGHWISAGSTVQQDEKYDRFTDADVPFKVKLVQTQRQYAAKQPQMGTLWQNNTNHLLEWETTTALSITNANEGASLPAKTQTQAINDGMALWFTEKRSPPGPFYGAEGVWTGLGIFMDSYVERDGNVK
jgi:hypothetical protein